MNFKKIFSKKSKVMGFEDLPSRERKKIMKEAIKKTNKEQYEIVKAYREKCHARGL